MNITRKSTIYLSPSERFDVEQEEWDKTKRANVWHRYLVDRVTVEVYDDDDEVAVTAFAHRYGKSGKPVQALDRLFAPDFPDSLSEVIKHEIELHQSDRVKA